MEQEKDIFTLIKEAGEKLAREKLAGEGEKIDVEFYDKESGKEEIISLPPSLKLEDIISLDGNKRREIQFLFLDQILQQTMSITEIPLNFLNKRRVEVFTDRSRWKQEWDNNKISLLSSPSSEGNCLRQAVFLENECDLALYKTTNLALFINEYIDFFRKKT